MHKWSWILSRIVRQIWFRAGIMSVMSIVLAVLAGVVSPYIPYDFGDGLGQDAVGTILQIMASSMLAVTTFSLTAMVSAYASATQLATPRATQLLIGDSTSQNALSIFLGAFVFSIVGIIGLQTRAYGSDGRVILFCATVLVVIWVVVTLLRWIAHITAFGRMADVIDRVEDAASRAMRDFAEAPYLGGRPAVPIPPGAIPLSADDTGYVTHVDTARLGEIATRCDLAIHVTALPGAMVHPEREVMRIEGAVDDDARRTLIDAFTIERHRTFDQDPRLGVIALSEIASRALSPAINDPGTAIEILNALLRVLRHLPARAPDTIEVADRPHIYVPRPTIEEMLTDGFRPIIRDGGRDTEVMIRVTSTLAALHAALPVARAPIATVATQCVDRARRLMEDPDDLKAFEDAHRRLWPDTAAAA